MLEKVVIGNCTLYRGDCFEIMPQLTEKFQAVITDPPFGYLKHKLDCIFNENIFFENVMNITNPDCSLVFFGRGVTNAKWIVACDKLGFDFKEEIIWNKSYGSSPLMAITRVHETISIFGKEKAKIQKVKIPYVEMKSEDLSSIKVDINRIKTVFSNSSHFDALKKYLDSGKLSFDGDYLASTTITNGRKRVNRCISTAQTISEGMNEKSIIKLKREHYNAIHPTQKPVRLLERLLQLCLPNKPKEQIVVADFFAGSFSCGEACYNLGLDFIGIEIDKEYFDLGVERLKKIKKQTKLF